MQAIIGFVLGIAAVFLLKEYPACRPAEPRKPKTTDEQRLQWEYENFLKYDGEEQEEKYGQ